MIPLSIYQPTRLLLSSERGGVTMRCPRPGCIKPVVSRGLCETHYRQRVHRGVFGYKPADDVRAHVARLRELGWTWQQIGDAAGVSYAIPFHLMTRRRYRRVLPETRDALLSVPAIPQRSHRGVDSTGTRRRVQALAWMGWPCAEVAARAGSTGRSLATLISPKRRVSYALAARVAEVYDDLWDKPGPSRMAAAKARSHGFHPPQAWDDDAIDNPAAQPSTEADAHSAGIDLSEVDWLRDGGCSDEEIARRLGVTVGWIRDARRRRKEAA